MSVEKIIFLVVITNLGLINGDDSFITIPNFIRFPYSPTEGPFIGIFLALSLPLDLPEYSVFFSYNMEANYPLPENQTEFMYPPLVSKRSLPSQRKFYDRKYFYDVLEFKLKSHRYAGKSCLLRAICEFSLYTSQFTGVLGDLLHVLLTPSSSINDNISMDYERAERWGKTKKCCKKFETKCSISLLGLFSKILQYGVN